MISEVHLAVARTVRQYKEGNERGAALVARRLGRNPTYFTNQVSPDYPGAHLSIEDFGAIMDLTGDYSPLLAFASERRVKHTCIALGDYTRVSDMELLDLTLNMHERIGKTEETIRKAFEDGKLTREEFDEIERCSNKAIQAMFERRARLEALIVE